MQMVIKLMLVVVSGSLEISFNAYQIESISASCSNESTTSSVKNNCNGSYKTEEEGTLTIKISGSGNKGWGGGASITITKIIDSSGFEYSLK